MLYYYPHSGVWQVFLLQRLTWQCATLTALLSSFGTTFRERFRCYILLYLVHGTNPFAGLWLESFMNLVNGAEIIREWTKCCRWIAVQTGGIHPQHMRACIEREGVHSWTGLSLVAKWWRFLCLWSQLVWNICHRNDHGKIMHKASPDRWQGFNQPCRSVVLIVWSETVPAVETEMCKQKRR